MFEQYFDLLFLLFAFSQFFDFVVDFSCFFFFFDFLVWEGRREMFFSIFVILVIFLFLCFFPFYFLIWVLICLFMFFGFSDHIWPAPLLAHTTFETVFCPNLCVENLGQWGCSSGQFVSHVLFLGHGPPAMDPPYPRPVRDPPLWCGCVVVVSLWCVFTRLHPVGHPSAQNFAHFPSPRHNFRSFFSLLGSFRGISVVCF